MKYTQIPQDTFKHLQLNAGIVTTVFEPSTGEVAASSILGATSGGVTFEATPSYTDFGEDIDNCPANTKELKRIDSWEAKLSGTLVTFDATSAVTITGAADVSGDKVTPRSELKASDFKELWWIGDYSDVNEDGTSKGKAGFIAVHLLNALSTGGLKIAATDKAKGTFDFEFTGHYSMDGIDTVPFELYVHAGTEE